MKYKISLYDVDVQERVEWAINNCYSYIFHETTDISLYSKKFYYLTEFYFGNTEDAKLFVEKWKPL